jgi:transposase
MAWQPLHKARWSKNRLAATFLCFGAGAATTPKLLWWDGQGMCLFAKRLEKGRFIWPQAESGSVSLTPAQLSMLLEGIDWRMPVRTWQPTLAA